MNKKRTKDSPRQRARARFEASMKGIPMSEPARIASEIDPADAMEAEVEEAIALCGGDVRAALRATLVANTYLQDEVDRLTNAVSAGFARGKVRRKPKATAEEKKAG